MPYERGFLAYLGGDDEALHVMRVYFRQNRGKILEYMVQYEFWTGDDVHPVVRFDNAHGFPHRDQMTPGGLQIKTPLRNLTNEEALSTATDEIEERFMEYYEWYQRELRKKTR